MASALKNLSKYDDSTLPEVNEKRFGIVVAEYHTDITHALYEGAYDTLVKHGVDTDNIFTGQVPGAFELPLGAKLLYGQHKLDAVICLGCVIKGETKHDEYINTSVANALQTMSIASSKPFIFGVLTPNTEAQAKARAGGAHGNKGVEAAITAIRMVGMKASLAGDKKSIGF
ncbi:MAG: 6,7-dimethyl-8-ribityllumazine synthase [Bacteroidota bacterium]